MKKIAIIVTMLLTISTFAQVNPSQPTQNSENAAHKRNNQAVFLFSFKENEHKIKSRLSPTLVRNVHSGRLTLL
jgi:hypothetical protein